MAYELLDGLRIFIERVARRFRHSADHKRFSVLCRKCGRVVPAGAETFPFHSVRVRCCLCGASDTYRPSEVTLQAPHALVRHQEKQQLLRQKRRPANRAGLSIVSPQEPTHNPARSA